MKFETKISKEEMERLAKASLERVETRLYEELLNSGFNPDTFDESMLPENPEPGIADSLDLIKKLLDSRKLILERLEK